MNPHAITHKQESHLATGEDEQWFVHSDIEPHAQEAHGRINENLIGGILLLTVIAVGAVIALFLSYVPRHLNALQVLRREDNTYILQEVREAKTLWEVALTGPPAWIDARAGTVRIPALLQPAELAEGRVDAAALVIDAYAEIDQ